jgi:hypothetical protein
MESIRTEAGTLRCACGKTGKVFACIGSYERDGKMYGTFAGFCDECYDQRSDDATRAFQEAVRCLDKRQNEKQPRMF